MTEISFDIIDDLILLEITSFFFSCSKVNSSIEKKKKKQKQAFLQPFFMRAFLLFVQLLSGDVTFSKFTHHSCNNCRSRC